MKFSKLVNLNEDDKDIVTGIETCLSKAGIKYYAPSLKIEDDGGKFPVVKIGVRTGSVEITTLVISLNDDGKNVAVSIEDLWTTIDKFSTDMNRLNEVINKLKSVKENIINVFKSDSYTD